MASPSSFPEGPPYASNTATVGGAPTKTIDVPVTAVFLFLYVCLAATNATIFRLNRRKHHKSIISALLGGFCNVRTITCSLRIAWALNLDNVSLVIAAEILLLAGNLILYIINLVFAQRILRARHPEIGWDRRLSFVLKSLYAVIGCVLVMVISTIVLSYYTLDEYTLRICRDIYLFGSSYIFFFATLPVGILLFAFLRRRSPNPQHFGRGSTELKALVLLASSSLCILIAGSRAGTTYMSPRPTKSPAWYDSKASFYSFGFVPEVLILLLFVIARVDLLFKVPDDSSKVRSFEKAGELESPIDADKSGESEIVRAKA
ncbi:39S ribosomal protein L16, mitochondrial [Friedmanniomyces endolithicus]|nr:39S ribosomal protein L16, mitochondrial [Friedmanniomyces endolithicus]KAK1815574.1 39S ribosomal protein L16, mitochondrial [Friedmanniomyces endolithicus]